MLSGARDTVWTATPLQAYHSRLLASARTKVRQRFPHCPVWYFKDRGKSFALDYLRFLRGEELPRLRR